HVAGADIRFLVAAARRDRRVVLLHALLRIILHRLAGLRIEPLGPGHLLDEGQTPDELAAVAIDRIGKAVAVGLERELQRRVVRTGDVDQHVFRHAVIVVGIVRRVLVVPLDLAGVGVEAERGVGVGVVTGPVFIVPVRSGIADAPDDGVGRGVVASGDPGRTTAARLGVLVILPG
ncbi:hypothetical protein SA6_12180, partial [Staphylococcus epidermidis]